MYPFAKYLLTSATKVKELNDLIFSSLEVYMPSPLPAPLQLHPPTEEIKQGHVRKMSMHPTNPNPPLSPTQTSAKVPPPVPPAPVGYKSQA